MLQNAFRIVAVFVCLALTSCAGSRFSIGSLPRQVECIAVMPFEIRYDMDSPREMLSEFVALDLYKQGAHGVLGPLELIELFKQANEPLPPVVDPYWAKEVGNKLNVDAVLFGSITQIPVYRGEEKRAHMNIDAYLLDVKSGAIRWSYGSKEEVSLDAYIGIVSDRAAEMVQVLLADSGDRHYVGHRGCWTPPGKVKTPEVAKKAPTPSPKTDLSEPLGSDEIRMLRNLNRREGLLWDASIFEGRSTRLSKEAIPKLRKLGRVLRDKRAPRRITIGSHLDASQDIGKDLALSKRRAEILGRYLVKLGVSKNRINAVGFGGSKPKLPNINERSREMNRRIHIFSTSSIEK